MGQLFWIKVAKKNDAGGFSLKIVLIAMDGRIVKKLILMMKFMLR